MSSIQTGITYIPSVVTVAHEELAGSPKEKHGDNGFSAIRTLKCLWDDREQLAEELMGGGLFQADNNSIVKTGAIYPHRDDTQVVAVDVDPFFPAAVVQDVQGESIASYQDAIVVVSYNNFFDLGEDPGTGTDENQNTEESIDSFTEFLTGPPFQICDSEAGGYSPGTPSTWQLGDTIELSKLVTGFEWVFTRRRQPGVGAASFNLMGFVNNSVIASQKLQFNFPLETLLYKGVSMRSGRSVAGVLNWDISFRLGFRGFDNSSWNKFWDFKQSKWIVPVRCDTGLEIKTYPGGNIAGLVQPNVG